MKVLFVYNPHSGRMQIKFHLWDIINILSNAYKDLNVYSSKKKDDIFNYVSKNGSKYDLLIVSGGDGTVSEAINGLMKLDKKPKLAYIPAGSTNDYATSLKLPSDMRKCAKCIVNPKENKKIDIGKFNNSYFVYVAAFGAFTEVAYDTPQDIKNVLGHLAYLLSGLTSIAKIKSHNLSITIDNKTYTDDYIYGMVSNSLSIGGIYRFNKKDVLLDDGFFEVMLIKQPKDLIDLSEITAYLLNQIKHTDLVQVFKTNRVTITSKKKLAWTLDGEYGGSHNKVIITNQNKAITIVK